MKYCSKCMSPIEATDVECPFCGSAINAEIPLHHLAPGTILNNKFMVGAALGEGGFGITYIGRDTKLDMKVAIKEYYPNGYVNRSNTISPTVNNSTSGERKEFFDKGRENFLREAQILAKFSGSIGIVDVRDFFEENNTAYIVMEYLDGQTLKEYLKSNGVLTAEQTIRLLMPVMESLKKVHTQGLIHRDISPDNIMLIDDHVKLLDFGAARNVSATANKSLSVMLKPGYAPEEQYRSKGDQGPWTDVYALCATMYKCITGITPDDSTQRVFSDELKTPSALGISIDPDIEKALLKGLNILQKDRYQNIDELLNGFKGINAVEDDESKTVCGGVVSKPKKEQAQDLQKVENGESAKDENKGAAIDSTVNDALSNSEMEPEKEKRKKPGIIILLAVLIIVLLIIFFVMATITGKDESEKAQSSVSDYDSSFNSTLQIDTTDLTTSVTTTTITPAITVATANITTTTTTTTTTVAQGNVTGTTIIATTVGSDVTTKNTTVSTFTSTTTKSDDSTTSKVQSATTTKATTTTAKVTTTTQAVPKCLVYTISNGEVAITDCDITATGALVIPSSIEGYPVTSIGGSAFDFCDQLTSISIPSSVTSIGEGAFWRCTALSSVTLPYGITSINCATFAHCTSLTSITIPDSVRYISCDLTIEGGAFYNCSSLTSITIPNSVIEIGYTTFLGCDSLKSVVIGNGVTKIGQSAFHGCDSLTSITIPNSVTSIGDFAFFYCTSLTTITIPNSVTSIGKNAFAFCDSLASITIPDSVTSIGYCAFCSCNMLTSVSIGRGVTIVTESAFFGCNSLSTVIIPDSVKSIELDAFDGCGSLTDVYYEGTQAQWDAITIGSNNEYLTGATIHYNS